MFDEASTDYLFLTHLGDYIESCISEDKVLNLIDRFPGKTYLVNEFPREYEDFENNPYGENIVPEENHLQTVVGLGEPETAPQPEPDRAFLGGFETSQCQASTAEKLAEEYSQNVDYFLISDFSILGGRTVEEILEENQIETLQELEQTAGSDRTEALTERYPENTQIVRNI